MYRSRSLELLQKLADEAERKRIDENDFMPTSIQKRRIVYCDDKLWQFVRDKARKEGITISRALRRIIKGAPAPSLFDSYFKEMINIYIF